MSFIFLECELSYGNTRENPSVIVQSQYPFSRSNKYMQSLLSSHVYCSMNSIIDCDFTCIDIIFMTCFVVSVYICILVLQL